MLKITSVNVNDRIANRNDSVVGILGSELLGCLHYLRRSVTHQSCFASIRASKSRIGGRGMKRNAYEPSPSLPAMPQPWHLGATARGARFAG